MNFMKKYLLRSETEDEHVIRDFSEVEQSLRKLDWYENTFAILSSNDEEYIQCATMENLGYVVEVRTQAKEGIRHYRLDVADRDTVLSYFRAYFLGGLKLDGWEDVTEEMVRQPMELQEPVYQDFKAYASNQLLEILSLLSGNDPELHWELGRSLQEDKISPEKLEDCLRTVETELRAASWLPSDFRVNLDLLAWTRGQWENLVSLLRRQQIVQFIDEGQEESLRVFNRMLDSMMEKKGLQIHYHTAVFEMVSKRKLMDWCCVADGILEKAGYRLIMLGKQQMHYPFMLVPREHAQKLWELSFSIGMRAASMRQYSYFSSGSLIVTADAQERIKIWKSTGLLQKK